VTRGSAESKAIGKRAVYDPIDMDQSQAYAYAAEVMAAASLSADAQEGIAAFMERRAPVWGRYASK
jgi:enoyl-CoA hydratase/carnithine racemase